MYKRLEIFTITLAWLGLVSNLAVATPRTVLEHFIKTHDTEVHFASALSKICQSRKRLCITIDFSREPFVQSYGTPDVPPLSEREKLYITHLAKPYFRFSMQRRGAETAVKAIDQVLTRRRLEPKPADAVLSSSKILLLFGFGLVGLFLFPNRKQCDRST